VDFKNGFTTVAENIIPLFQEVDIKEGFKNYPYYFERTPYKTNETQKWLTRKYQQYKSMTNLFKMIENRDTLGLNETLFSVERETMQFNNISFTFLHWRLME